MDPEEAYCQICGFTHQRDPSQAGRRQYWCSDVRTWLSLEDMTPKN